MGARTEIAELTADYWLRVDQRTVEPVEELYTEDGVFHAGAALQQGRAAIGAFYAERVRRQLAEGRRTRHLQVNLHTALTDPDRAVCHSTVVVFAGVGEPPIESGTVSTVADVEDVLVRSPEHGWRFQRRTMTAVFTGPGAAAFVRPGPGPA
ncbi:MAG TPA: nuclear transport factor 2 family protein [Actinocrinis sp.]|nr:nuclear transport factor 2 family protein [Actinocrinis sp.]